MSEEVRYYKIKNVFGSDAIMSVVTSDFVYNNITNDNIQTIMPWEKLQVPLTHVLPINFESLLPFEGLGVTFNLHQYSATPRPVQYNFYFEGTDTRWVWFSTSLNPSSILNDSSREYGISSNHLPIGSYYANSRTDFTAYVLITNDDMSQHKVISFSYESNGTVTYSLLRGTIWNFNPKNYFEPIKPTILPKPDPYEDAGGGEGPLPGSQTIGLPDEPTVSPIDAGLFSLYSPTASQMRNLADFLWTDFGGTGTTVEQVLEEVVEALKRSVSNPLNSMLGLSIIASQGLSKGSDSSVHVGFWDTGVSMTKLTKQYFNVDCGSLSFDPVCGNTFLDYAPYSKFMIFLPYVGMRILDANDVVGHTISIKYRGDCVSGALTCYVIRDNSVIQEHTGNCALNIPLTADSWAETISSVGRIISGSVSGATRTGAAGAAAGAVRGAASVATNPSAFSPQVAHTGAVSGAAGHLGSQKPFILREAVRFHSTGNFNSIIGYPSYYYRKLGDCHGYTQCLEVHLSHTPCTGVELQEIEDLLKKGVII
jgi:hypothetical protein